jgi:hypothetical protein
VFDIYLLTLNLNTGREIPDLPGIYVAPPPRRSQRIRTGDQFIILASLGGNLELSPATLLDMLQRTGNSYFTTHGSVTNGLRASVEQLNDLLIARNSQKARESLQATSLLNLAVIHNNILYLAHIGPVHSLLLGQEQIEHYHEAQSGERGLGLSKTINLRFFQTTIQAGDVLILSPAAPENWTAEALQNAVHLPLDHLRRRLLTQVGPDLQAAVVQLQAGTGQLHRMKPRSQVSQSAQVRPAPTAIRPSIPPMAVPPKPPEPAVQAPSQAMPTETQPAETTAGISELEQAIAPAPPPTETGVEPVPEIEQSAPTLETQEATSTQPPATEGIYLTGERLPLAETTGAEPPPEPPLKPVVAATEKAATPSLRKRLAMLWLAGKRVQQQTSHSGRAAMSRLMPGKTEETPYLPNGIMVAMAIFIPFLVVAVALQIYSSRGKSRQFQAYYNQAVISATQAAAQTDPAIKRSDWSLAVDQAKKAYELDRNSQDAKDLMKDTQLLIDSMDGITRLDFSPAIRNGFSSTVEINKLVANSTDIYALDSNKGRVLRMSLVGSGYEVDPDFSCGPGPSGTIMINPLVDITLPPANNQFKATLLAIDASGNLLYCIPGSSPVSSSLPPPDTNFGAISAFTYDQDNLYVLDIKNNAVWIYQGQNGAFGERPHLFFDNDIPPLKNVIDIANSNEDLYLLHSDGKMSLCTYKSASFAHTRCTNPAPYADQRPGHDGQEVSYKDAHFAQMQTTLPPDPSLYILDTSGSAIYHFSLRLNLQRQLRASNNPDMPTPKTPPTAFAINSDRMVFLAYDNQVYYASLP